MLAGTVRARACTGCGEVKPLTDYYAHPRHADGYQRRCKACVIRLTNEARTRRRAEGREKPRVRDDAQRAYEAEWRAANRDKALTAQRKSKYGITDIEFRTLLAEQGGRCRICLGEMTSPHVDHCHTSGRVRGLLCGPCNRAIGLLKDDPDAAQRAAEYLRTTEVRSAPCL